MRHTSWKWLAIGALTALAFAGCGTTTDTGTPSQVTAEFAIGANKAFGADFTVAPGTVIHVTNDDAVPHDISSESADGAFDGVGGLTSGNIAGSGGTASFQIPGTTASGTVLSFYCQYHQGMMSPANFHITVQGDPVNTGAGGPPPGGGSPPPYGY